MIVLGIPDRTLSLPVVAPSQRNSDRANHLLGADFRSVNKI
jgi:hypothetical protein